MMQSSPISNSGNVDALAGKKLADDFEVAEDESEDEIDVTEEMELQSDLADNEDDDHDDDVEFDQKQSTGMRGAPISNNLLRLSSPSLQSRATRERQPNLSFAIEKLLN